MRTTFGAVAVLAVCSLVCACDEDKKPTEAAPSATPPPGSAAEKAAPVAKPSPAEAASKATKALVAAWNAHDAAKIAALYEPTGKLVIPGLSDFAGSEAIASEAKQDFTAYSDFKVGVSRTFVHGNTIAVEWVITGTNDGPFMGQKPSGRQMGVAGASVSTIDDDGLIKEEHRYVDLPTIQSQLDPKAKAGSFRAPMALPTGPIEEHVSKGTPDEAKTIDQGNAIMKIDEGHDTKAILATVTDDYVWEEYPAPAATKKADLAGALGNYTKAFPDWTVPATMTFAVDGYYVAEAVFTGTQKGPMGPIKASNKPVKLRMLDIQQIKDGKAAREWSYSDSAEMLVQIGAMPPIGAPPAAAASVVAASSPAPSPANAK